MGPCTPREWPYMPPLPACLLSPEYPRLECSPPHTRGPSKHGHMWDGTCHSRRAAPRQAAPSRTAPNSCARPKTMYSGRSDDLRPLPRTPEGSVASVISGGNGPAAAAQRWAREVRLSARPTSHLTGPMNSCSADRSKGCSNGRSTSFWTGSSSRSTGTYVCILKTNVRQLSRSLAWR